MRREPHAQFYERPVASAGRLNQGHAYGLYCARCIFATRSRLRTSVANRYGRYTTTSAIIHCRDRLGVPEWALGVAAGNEEMMAQSGALALVTIS